MVCSPFQGRTPVTMEPRASSRARLDPWLRLFTPSLCRIPHPLCPARRIGTTYGLRLYIGKSYGINPAVRDQDLADSPLASHRDLPSDHVDSVRDFLAEAFLQFTGPLPKTHAEFRLTAGIIVAEGWQNAEQAGAVDDDGGDEATAIVRGLQYMARFPSWHIAGPAVAMLRLLGHEGDSFDQLGKRFGNCRAAVQILYARIQKMHGGLRSRGDKSDDAREECRRRRVGFRQKRNKSWTRPPASQCLQIAFRHLS